MFTQYSVKETIGGT